MNYLKQVFYILIYLNFVFIPVMQIWIFSIISSSWESRDPSKIIWICWFDVQETFIIITNF